MTEQTDCNECTIKHMEEIAKLQEQYDLDIIRLADNYLALKEQHEAKIKEIRKLLNYLQCNCYGEYKCVRCRIKSLTRL